MRQRRRFIQKNSEFLSKWITGGFILACMLTAVMGLASVSAQEIDVNKNDCSLQLTLAYTDTTDNTRKELQDGTVEIYQVAPVTQQSDGNFVFDIAGGQFSEVKAIENVTSYTSERLTAENASLAKTLSGSITGKQNKRSNIQNGTASFTGLTPGLYLVVQSVMSTGDMGFDPYLMTIPDANGNYQITANPKPGVMGTIEGDKPDETEKETPKETELETIKGGETEPEETEKETKKKEKETEKETKKKEPETEKPKTPTGGTTPGTSTGGGGGRLPQTGQLWWPVPVLALAGLLFIIIGLVRRKRVK